MPEITNNSTDQSVVRTESTSESGVRKVSFSRPAGVAARPRRTAPRMNADGTPAANQPTVGGRPGNNRPGGGRPGPGGRGGDRGPRREQPKPEFDSKTILVRRVTRVVKGGRRFSFSVSIVIGDKNGKVGVGVGKAADTGLAITKATSNAKKNMILIPLTPKKSITHVVDAKASSARVMVTPNFGKGLVAGSSVRTVLELAGITDVTSKVFSRSRNKLNNARSVVAALKKLT